MTNAYVVATGAGSIAIDAPAGMADFAREHGGNPMALLLTHQHFDHVQDAAAIARMGVPVYAQEPFSSDLTLAAAAARWGLPLKIDPFEVTHVLRDQEVLELEGVRFGVLPVPGHSPDSLVFHLEALGKAFAGDTLFAGSIGRTDLPGGDHRLLIDGIRERLLSLPPETEILPGHGPGTTVAQESARNPYLA